MSRKPRNPVHRSPGNMPGTKSQKITKLLQEGLALHRQGNLGSAKQIYEKILKKQRNHFDALHLLGIVYMQVEQNEESVKFFNKALQISKTNAEVLNNRGVALQKLRRFDNALKSYNEALRIKPDYVEAANNLGATLHLLNRFDEALTSFDTALRIKPDYAEALNNRGNVLQDLKRLNDALASYDEALRIKPDYLKALNNRGATLHELKRFDDALKTYDEALQIKSDFAEVIYNRGNVLQELIRFDDALASYDEALNIEPNYTEATWNKSLLLILTGNYLDGWMLYESRLEKEDLKTNYPTYPQLAWRGQDDIRGKKILIHSEQGLGDSIQFIRYLDQIHQLGAEIILEVPKTLATLANTIKTPITVIEKGSKLPEFDAYCPLLSLPYVFKTTVDTIPSVVPYLFADKKKVSEWNHRLGVKTRKRVGLVWSGSTVHKNDHNRSIPLEIFTDLLKLPVEWHSLQNEYRTKDKNFLDSHPEIRQHQEELGDFADTAALIECMDLVISVDTSVAHLAGALGKTTWILLPFIPDFRWMLEREDCPWYPTAKLLRQDVERDWKKVIIKLMREL